MKFIRIKNNEQLSKLIELNDTILKSESSKLKLKSDFKNGYFKGFFCVNEDYDKSQIDGYVIITNGYSTWQHRIIFVEKLWLNEKLDSKIQYKILKEIIHGLFNYARENDLKRINFNLSLISEENQKLYEFLKCPEIDIANMTTIEQWLIFEMKYDDLKAFASLEIKPVSDFRCIKVKSMDEYADSIRELIREIAIFESLEDQFETRSDFLIRDYTFEKETIDDKNSEIHSRYYECMIVLNRENQVIGYAIYFMNYDLERGRGCYLEDLYIQEKYRKQGLGTYFWSQVAKDALENFGATFMQWSVLEWNKSAIQFYFKYNSINLTELKKVNFLRFTTERIYSSF